MIRRIKGVIGALDDPRPITPTLNGAMFTEPNIADKLDVVSFSYGAA